MIEQSAWIANAQQTQPELCWNLKMDLASIATDNALAIYRHTGQRLFKSSIPSLRRVAWAPDGRSVAVQADNDKLLLIDIETRRSDSVSLCSNVSLLYWTCFDQLDMLVFYSATDNLLHLYAHGRFFLCSIPLLHDAGQPLKLCIKDTGLFALSKGGLLHRYALPLRHQHWFQLGTHLMNLHQRTRLLSSLLTNCTQEHSSLSQLIRNKTRHFDRLIDSHYMAADQAADASSEWIQFISTLSPTAPLFEWIEYMGGQRGLVKWINSLKVHYFQLVKLAFQAMGATKEIVQEFETFLGLAQWIQSSCGFDDVTETLQVDVEKIKLGLKHSIGFIWRLQQLDKQLSSDITHLDAFENFISAYFDTAAPQETAESQQPTLKEWNVDEAAKWVQEGMYRDPLGAYLNSATYALKKATTSSSETIILNSPSRQRHQEESTLSFVTAQQDPVHHHHRPLFGGSGTTVGAGGVSLDSSRTDLRLEHSRHSLPAPRSGGLVTSASSVSITKAVGGGVICDLSLAEYVNDLGSTMSRAPSSSVLRLPFGTSGSTHDLPMNLTLLLERVQSGFENVVVFSDGESSNCGSIVWDLKMKSGTDDETKALCDFVLDDESDEGIDVWLFKIWDDILEVVKVSEESGGIVSKRVALDGIRVLDAKFLNCFDLLVISAEPLTPDECELSILHLDHLFCSDTEQCALSWKECEKRSKSLRKGISKWKLQVNSARKLASCTSERGTAIFDVDRALSEQDNDEFSATEATDE